MFTFEGKSPVKATKIFNTLLQAVLATPQGERRTFPLREVQIILRKPEEVRSGGHYLPEGRWESYTLRESPVEVGFGDIVPTPENLLTVEKHVLLAVLLDSGCGVWNETRRSELRRAFRTSLREVGNLSQVPNLAPSGIFPSTSAVNWLLEGRQDHAQECAEISCHALGLGGLEMSDEDILRIVHNPLRVFYVGEGCPECGHPVTTATGSGSHSNCQIIAVSVA